MEKGEFFCLIYQLLIPRSLLNRWTVYVSAFSHKSRHDSNIKIYVVLYMKF